MKKFLFVLFLVIITTSIAMENKPSHHQSNGTFKNPEGSPERTGKVKWSWSTFNKEKKKLDMTVPKSHVLNKNEVLKNLELYKDKDYIGWIGHATFLIKLGNTTIITDPVFSKNAGPLIFGPKRYVDPALSLNEIPKVDLFLLTRITTMTIKIQQQSESFLIKTQMLLCLLSWVSILPNTIIKKLMSSIGIKQFK